MNKTSSKKENNKTKKESFEFNSYYDYQNVSSSGMDSLIFGNNSYETLKSIIRYPMENNAEIRHLSREIYSASGLYSNVVDYMASL